MPRDSCYILGTKLGRYDRAHFDFSAKRVAESVDVSLHRLGVEYLDIILCHDIEFVDMAQIVQETLPALRKIQQQGKVRFVGVSGYPMNVFRYILDRTELDVVLSYNHYTLQNTMLADLVPYLQGKGIGIMNAAPFSARLLTSTQAVARVAQGDAVSSARRRPEGGRGVHLGKGVDIAQLALQYSLANEVLTTCVVGSANPENVRKWAEWAEMPIDPTLLAEVLEILRPIHDWHYTEGRPENNDPPSEPGV